MRRWVLFWCVQSYAVAWDVSAAVQPVGHALAPDPYPSSFVLAPDPYPVARQGAAPPVAGNRRSRRAHVASRLAPNPYAAASASLASMPYLGGMPEREIARPSSQPLALAASPYEGADLRSLAPDPY